jgi:serine phosphatase RsbU (regulator of sigma subunit)
MRNEPASLILHPLDPTQDGDRLEPFSLEGQTAVVVGRAAEADWTIPDLGVSRRHARLETLGGEWFISDLDSRHGTFVNGRRLEPGERVALRAGDGLMLGHWRVLCEESGRTSVSFVASDAQLTEVKAVPRQALAGLAQTRLDAVLSATRELSSARDRDEIARILRKTAQSGTNCVRVSVVRSVGTDEYILLGEQSTQRQIPLSRSLLRSAESGSVAQMMGSGDGTGTNSLAILKVRSAICAPLMIAGQPDCFLYIDTRESEPDLPPDSASFCAALADLGALAIERTIATDMAARRMHLERDLDAARQAQLMLLPPRRGDVCGVRYAYESVAGRYVAGDMFDVVALPNGRAAFFLGDVSGKGISAGVLMAATQAQLRALLLQGVDLATSIRVVSDHLFERTEPDKFVTLLAGVWCASERTMELVDAGHGFCAIKQPEGPVARLDLEGGIPAGVSSGTRYGSTKLRLDKGSRVLTLSDGVTEQPNAAGDQFGFDAALQALHSSGDCAGDVSAIIEAVRRHAPGGAISDDLTVASLELL